MSSCRVSYMVALCAASLLIACGGDSDGGGGDGPCEASDAPAECGAACDESNPCADGFYCGADDTCTAECTGAAEGCADGEECTADGRCESAGDDDGGDGGDGDGGDDEECPAIEVNLTPVVPDVVLLIDQSSSMNAGFPNDGDPTRWDAINLALIGNADDGVVFQLQNGLSMGATLYTSHAGADDVIVDACPFLRSTPEIAVNNAAAIQSLLNTDPDDDTPTGPSIDAVVETFPESDNPHVIVLATDGLPDTCTDPNPGNAVPPGGAITQDAANEVAETAAQDAFAAGVSVIPLSVAPTPEAVAHLQRVANLGAGLAPDEPEATEAEVYEAATPEELIAAFETIVGGIRSCDIDLEDEVDLDRADEGTVILNGEELEYGEDADWFMIDEDTFQLRGAACETYKGPNEVNLSAEFPCGVVVDVD